MYLLDSCVFLEILLEQNKSQVVKDFLNNCSKNDISITNFSLHSICAYLTKNKKTEILKDFILELRNNNTKIFQTSLEETDLILSNCKRFSLDFDDAYQYTIAKIYGLQLVSFDKDFDKTDLKRIEP